MYIYICICCLCRSIAMAKQISQETFDSVVRENMEEFDMPADEAMQEAVTQFEAQVNQLVYSNNRPNKIIPLFPVSRRS